MSLLRRFKNLICYLLLFLALFLLSVFYRQPFYVFACLLLAFLPFVSYYISRYVFERLSLSLDSLSREGIKGSCFPLVLSFENLTPFPLLHMEITLHISSPFYENAENEQITIPVLARSSNEHRFPVTYSKIGCYQIEALQYLSYDYLHLFCFKEECSCHTEVVILPENTQEILLENSFYSEGFDEFDEVSGKGFVQNDISDIREYIPGDRLQKVHWKLSSKLDKLMVREAAAGAMHCFIVLAELYKAVQTEEDAHSDTIDASLENAYAVCHELQRQGEPTFFTVYSIVKEDFLLFRIQTKEDITRAFTQIFYERPYAEENLAYTYFQASEIMKGTVIHVTHEGIYDEEE
ncbi:MAG: DUF58 domain-containing protein [Lachnospiraceae bacterium]|nr:DUF58 domain-containing protein [Lachnospiraceae bacterium]